MYSITDNKEFIVSTINIILVGKNEENHEKNSKHYSEVAWQLCYIIVQIFLCPNV